MANYENNLNRDEGHVQEQLSDYMDGLLAGDAREAVRAHLESCADCRADYIELRAAQKLMQSMPVMAAPRSFTLTPEMAGQARKASFWERLFVPRNAPRLATGSVVAFLLLILVMTGNVLGGNRVSGFVTSSNSGTSNKMASATADATTTTAAPEAFGPSTMMAAGTPNAAAEPTSAATGGTSSDAAVPAPTDSTVAQPAPPGAPEASSEGPPPDQGGARIEPTPETTIDHSGNASPTTTTLENNTPAPAAFRDGSGGSGNSGNQTGWAALEVALMALGLALGVGALIAWRRT